MLKKIFEYYSLWVVHLRLILDNRIRPKSMIENRSDYGASKEVVVKPKILHCSLLRVDPGQDHSEKPGLSRKPKIDVIEPLSQNQLKALYFLQNATLIVE